MIEIDLASSDWAFFLARLRERHGQVVHAAQWLTRLFVLSSAWAPGLCFVGGRADPKRAAPDFTITGLIDVGGVGVTREQALIACLGETAERLSQIERSGDARPAPLDDFSKAIAPSVLQRIQNQCDPPLIGLSLTVDWVVGYMLDSRLETHIPADWCLRRRRRGPLLEPDTPLSTGTAAGRTWEDAAERALLELVERDAAALWWLAGRRGRPLDPRSSAEAKIFLDHLRGRSDKRETWLLDITTDLGIPVVASISAGSSGRGFACGLAARLSTVRAAEHAILEMCQMEVGLQIAQWKAENQPDTLTDSDRRHLARAEAIDTASCDLLQHAGTWRAEPQATVHSRTANNLSLLQSAFAAGGVEAVLCDLTRSDIGVPVAWSVAPDLQIFPSTYRTVRLVHTIQCCGGGARYTGDVPLL